MTKVVFSKDEKKKIRIWLQEHQQTHPNSVWAAIIEELIEELDR